MEVPQLVVENVTKDYDANTRALDGVSFEIREGEWVNIIGPSGSGKTTLLNLISCLDKPTSGSIRINGTDLSTFDRKALTKFRRENIGLIFQQYHLVPHLTALENVMLAQYFHSTVDEDCAKKVLERVGMGHRLNSIPSHLSGGEQQRVCVARALVNDPCILVADEPTGNLDMRNGELVLSLISELNAEGHTVILVTHNMDIAKKGNRTVNIIDGRIAGDNPSSG